MEQVRIAFKVLDSDECTPPSYKKVRCHMVFDVKQDLTRNCRLVAGGHLVDLLDVQACSSTVKSASVQLLHAMPHKAGLE